MEFHHHYSEYDTFLHTINKQQLKEMKKRAGGRDNLLKSIYTTLRADMLRGRRSWTGEESRQYCELVAEQEWHDAGRPYYNVWPGIVRYLTRIKLSKVPARCLHLPVPALALRFPVQNNPVTISFRDGPNVGKTLPLKSIFVCHVSNAEDDKPADDWALLATCCFNPFPGSWVTESRITSSVHLHKEGDVTLEEEIATIKDRLSGGDMEIESYLQVVRIITTICLLSTEYEEELILPEVLKADEEAWNRTHDPKYLVKAKRLGKYGWNIGKSFESVIPPHWRGPCPFALYYYGPRPGTPRLRYRKGCMVHRATVTKVPTGTEDMEEPLDEL